MGGNEWHAKREILAMLRFNGTCKYGNGLLVSRHVGRFSTGSWSRWLSSVCVSQGQVVMAGQPSRRYFP